MSLTNLQYAEIIRSYNKKELENKRQQTKRTALIFEKIPRIKEINELISSLSLETTKRLLLSDDETSMKEFHTKLQELTREKQRLLIDHGFSPDDLEMHYSCKDCRDTGFIDGQKCHCFKKAEVELLYRQSNLQEILNIENFSTFRLDRFDDNIVDPVTKKTPKENMQSVLSVCRQFINEFGGEDVKHRNLLFFGKTGVGKTFLTHCIAKELLEQAVSVVYLSAISFFQILSRTEFEKNDEQAKSQYTNLMGCDLLIIDDLGTELSTSFTNSAFFNTINERLLQKKPVIISTNLNFSELMERYSERLTSRLTSEYTFLKIYGKDLRHPD